MPVQLDDVAILLQGRYELVRRDNLAGIANPAHEGLRPHNPAIPQLALRLQVKGKLRLFQAAGNLRHQLHFRYHLPRHLLIKPVYPRIEGINRLPYGIYGVVKQIYSPGFHASLEDKASKDRPKDFIIPHCLQNSNNSLAHLLRHIYR